MRPGASMATAACWLLANAMASDQLVTATLLALNLAPVRTWAHRVYAVLRRTQHRCGALAAPCNLVIFSLPQIPESNMCPHDFNQGLHDFMQ